MWFVLLARQDWYLAAGVIFTVCVFIVCFFSWLPSDKETMKWKLRYQEHMNAFHPDVEETDEEDDGSY